MYDDAFATELNPSWPYHLGALGAAVLGIAALLLTAGAVTATPGPDTEAAMFGLIVGGALLTIAWFGMITHGPGGAGTALGSLGLTAGHGFAWYYRQDWSHAELRNGIVGLALVGFAAGHLFVRRLPVTRCGAVVASITAIVLLALHRDISLGTARALTTLFYGGVATIGFSLAMTLPGRQYGGAS